MTPSSLAAFACNCTSLRKAARHVTRFYDSCLAEVGLRGTQYAILHHLVADGAMAMGRLAEILSMDRATIGHNLRPLERDGLIVIKVGERDRREREVAVSAAGRQLEATARPHWIVAQEHFEREFGGGDATEMRALMARIVALDLPAPDHHAVPSGTSAANE